MAQLRWVAERLSDFYEPDEPPYGSSRLIRSWMDAIEIHFRMRRDQPVFPSKMQHDLFEACVRIGETKHLADRTALADLDVDARRYREILHGRTQEIASAAACMGFHGVIAPPERWACRNTVLFFDKLGDLDHAIAKKSSSPVDWKTWRAKQNNSF